MNDTSFISHKLFTFIYSLLLVHSHIIYLHFLRPDIFIDAFLSTPVATHRNIQEQMHFIIKGPCIIAAMFIAKPEKSFLINRYLDAVFIPFHRIYMKFF